jgi:Ca2+-binding EF-hand superfamily protein
MATSLTAEELELCKKAFQAFDKDGAAAAGADFIRPKRTLRLCAQLARPDAAPGPAGSYTIDVKELKSALNTLGQFPTDEELFVMINQVRRGLGRLEPVCMQ